MKSKKHRLCPIKSVFFLFFIFSIVCCTIFIYHNVDYFATSVDEAQNERATQPCSPVPVTSTIVQSKQENKISTADLDHRERSPNKNETVRDIRRPFRRGGRIIPSTSSSAQLPTPMPDWSPWTDNLPQIIHSRLLRNPDHDVFAFGSRNGIPHRCFIKTIENMCFSQKLKKFVVAREDVNKLSPEILEAKRPGFEVIPSPLNRRDNPHVWFFGGLMLAPDFTFQQSGTHFWLGIWPTMHFVNVLRTHFKNRRVGFWVDDANFKNIGYESRIWQFLFQGFRLENGSHPSLNPQNFKDFVSDYVMEDSPILSLYNTRTLPRGYPIVDRYFCFRESIFAPWVQCKSRVSSYEDVAAFKNNILKIFPHQVESMPHICSEVKGKVVSILQRVVRTRNILNIDDLVELVSGMTQMEPKDINVFDSAGDRVIISDVILFHNITFLISVHGAGNANYVFLPKLAHVIEIFPYHFATTNMYELLAEDMGLIYFKYVELDISQFQLDNPNYSTYNATQCIKIPSCQSLAKKKNVVLTLTGENGLSEILEKAIPSWRELCKF